MVSFGSPELNSLLPLRLTNQRSNILPEARSWPHDSFASLNNNQTKAHTRTPSLIINNPFRCIEILENDQPPLTLLSPHAFLAMQSDSEDLERVSSPIVVWTELQVPIGLESDQKQWRGYFEPLLHAKGHHESAWARCRLNKDRVILGTCT